MRAANFLPERNRWLLRRAADPAKDQTYFLFGLTQEQLSRTLFPLGHMNKPQVRELAREHHLALAEKPDSQEICFVPGGDYKRFIDAYLNEQGEQLPDTSGELVTTDGKVLGHHEGIHNFTVGQRKGLGVATGSPLYVININGAEGKVTVGGNDDLLSRTLIAHELNWIAIDGLHDSGAEANAPMCVTPTRPCAFKQRSAIAMTCASRAGERSQWRSACDVRRAAARHHAGAGRGVLPGRSGHRRRMDCRNRCDKQLFNQTHSHSCRSAIKGSTRVALRAGM